LAQLAPYMDEVKFVPTVVASPPPLAPTTASLGTVERARKQLAHAEARGAAKQALQQPRNDVNAELMDLQAQSVALLVQTLGPGELPRQGTTNRNSIPLECAHPLMTPLSSFSRMAASNLCVIIDARLAKTEHVSNRHSREGSAIRMLYRALRHAIAMSSSCEAAAGTNAVQPVTPAQRARTAMSLFLSQQAANEVLPNHTRASEGFIKQIREIMASVLSRRGSMGSDQYKHHMQNVAVSLQGDQRQIVARVLMKRLSGYESFATLTCAEVKTVMSPIAVSDAANFQMCRLKRCHRKAITVAMEGSLSELLTHGAVASAEDAGVVAHKLVARLVASQFVDERLSRLYAEVATAFSRRRSLLLISGGGSFQHQARMRELPWMAPLLRELASGFSHGKAAAFAGTLLSEYWRYFPITLMPNKMTSALRELLHPEPTKKRKSRTSSEEKEPPKESPVPPMLEELAADIFGGTFSSKYHAVARTAAARIGNTTYSRYYQLDTMLPQLASGTLSIDAAAVALRDAYYGTPTRAGWSVSGNGKLVEAAQILTTHNLILFDDVPLVTDGTTNMLNETLKRSWQLLERLCAKSADNLQFSRKSQHARQIAHGFRQFVYFLSKLPSAEVQLAFLDSQLEAKPKSSSAVAGRFPFREKINGVRCAVRGEPQSADAIVLAWRRVE
ncbi:Hypothetical protein, putative, partial [Bodo saltans]